MTHPIDYTLLSPADTPRGFAERYNRACQALSAEGTVAQWADHLMRYLPDGTVQTRDGKDGQKRYLADMYEKVKQNGIASIVASDYMITQLSDDFAIVRFRWELTSEDGSMSGGINSAYVLRRDADGWVAICNLELGASHGP
ncbi:MAG: DUF4440 domain-containing protein [Pseudomonadota bacterium]